MRPLNDGEVAGLVGAAVLGAWLGSHGARPVVLLSVVLCSMCAWSRGRPRLRRWVRWWVLVLLVVGLHSTHSWRAAHSPRLGPYRGWADVIADPVVAGRGVRTVVGIDGQRFDMWAYGRLRSAVGRLVAGEQVWVSGVRAPSDDGRRAAVRHVVGTFAADVVADRRSGSPAMQSANRVRQRIAASADASMDDVDASLFTGLVMGDDRHQPRWLVDAFRRAGLSHLTAVSGQNVAYVLAGFAPLLSRLRPRPRWLATCLVVVWFMAVTRFEPSVLRAGCMAMTSATATALGRTASARRLVMLAVMALLLVDPLLLWSVSLWLSVGATLGVVDVAPRLVDLLPGPRWCRQALGTSFGAQVGVAIPSLLVFGHLSFVGPFANLFAVPVAGLVMLFGLPASLIVPALPVPISSWVMAPLRWGTEAVGGVALLASSLEPRGRWSTICWLTLLAVGFLWWCVRRRGAVPI